MKTEMQIQFFKAIFTIEQFKGSLTRDLISDLRFFHELFSRGRLSIPLGSFRIFAKIRGDIQKYRLITGINDTLRGLWETDS
jgi:hypothetical protein